MWKKQLSTINPFEIDKVLDKRVAKRTKNREYFRYSVKWKGHLVKNVTWMNVKEL